MEMTSETTATQKVTVKPFDTYHCRNNWIFFTNQYILLATPVGFEHARQRYLASQKPNMLQTELSRHPGCYTESRKLMFAILVRKIDNVHIQGKFKNYNSL